MDSRQVIYDTFLKKFEDSSRNNVGVELEFPMVNLSNAPVDMAVMRGLIDSFLDEDFSVEERDAEGNPVFISNADGDVLSFDNSYNNFEFSMEKNDNLLDISKRFYVLLDRAQSFLKPYNHRLVGLGTNPNKEYINSDPVSFDIYVLIKSFLSQYQGGEYHSYIDFPAYMSSVQTHLDLPLNSLPKALTIFAKLDFVRAILFSNSPAFGEEKEKYPDCKCFRDYLWEKSGFGSLSNNVGKVNKTFDTVDDIIDDIGKRSMFHNNTGLIEPVSVMEYFKGNPASDMEHYLSFKNMEVTRRGTLEVRSDCAQPFDKAFSPPAFNLGVLSSLDECIEITDKFFAENNITSTNSQLRDDVIYYGKLPTDKDATYKFVNDIKNTARNALIKRGKGEEALLV
ncbi:MAG: hypothetical protein PHE51_01495 [Eubacteriales bacterium]|nr:hypothetical protein [Eubacteriales bacterium]